MVFINWKFSILAELALPVGSITTGLKGTLGVIFLIGVSSLGTSIGEEAAAQIV